jgi:hypothetical protein
LACTGDIVDASEDTHRFAFDLNNTGDFLDAGDIASTTTPCVDVSLPDQGPRTIRGRIDPGTGLIARASSPVRWR